jgi:glycosyltransferase involved in cell wall biosynthesis
MCARRVAAAPHLVLAAEFQATQRCGPDWTSSKLRSIHDAVRSLLMLESAQWTAPQPPRRSCSPAWCFRIHGDQESQGDMPTYLEEPKVVPAPMRRQVIGERRGGCVDTGQGVHAYWSGERVGIYFPQNDIFYDPRSQRSGLEAWVEARSVPEVSFAGWVPDVQVELARAGMVLAPAPAEPFGLGVIEAMGAGVPVVACGGGGHLETVARLSDAPLFARMMRGLPRPRCGRFSRIVSAANCRPSVESLSSPSFR